jgi:hypothetical protein
MNEEMGIVELGTESKPPARERRRLPRVECSETTRCQTTGLTFWARVKDVSKSGLGLVLCQKISVGTLVTATPWRTAKALRAKVGHCTQITAGSWLAGCEFNTALSDDELEKLVKTLR